MKHDPVVYDVAERIVAQTRPYETPMTADEYVKEVMRVADLLDPAPGVPTWP